MFTLCSHLSSWCRDGGHGRKWTLSSGYQSGARLQIAKPDQRAAALVPERQPPATDAFAQGYPFREPIQFWRGVETGLKSVVWNPAAQVVHVVQPDVP